VRFQLKQYGSEAVAFDTASGDTHYLAPLALALYQICRDCPEFSRDNARQLLEQRHAIDPGEPSPDAQIEETLAGLRRIGLIRLE
jgi:PqqD family protein of HPr-rel-A system